MKKNQKNKWKKDLNKAISAFYFILSFMFLIVSAGGNLVLFLLLKSQGYAVNGILPLCISFCLVWAATAAHSYFKLFENEKSK